MKKKIAILVKSLSGGGIERVVIQLAESFAEAGHDVHLILIQKAIAYDLSGNYTLHFLSASDKPTGISQLRPYRYAKKLKTILRDAGPFDLFLSNAGSLAGERLLALAKPENLYMVLHNTQSKRRFKRHEKPGLRKTLKMRKIQKSYAGKNIITVSRGVADDALHTLKLRPKSIRTIYNPFDFEKIRSLSQLPNPAIPKEPYIIHVARFELKPKRHDILLQAYKQSGIPHKLVLLGAGPDEQEVKALVETYGLADRVIFPGFDQNPYNWIRHADLFAFSSDYEGFGNVLVESLIVGTPVVSTDCPSGPSEILTGPLAAYLVPKGDSAALAAKMREALESYPEITEEMIERFDKHVITQQYLALMKA